MSTATDVLKELENQIKQLKVDGWKYEIDRDGNRLELSDKLHFGVDTDNKVLTITGVYNGHVATIGTRFKSNKHQRDENDTLVIDDFEMTNVYIDKDLIGDRVQIEARYTNPNETTDGGNPSGDNMETFNPGAAQHEIRFVKGFEFDSNSVIGKLINLIKEAV